jgi:hypothetical protein
MVDSLQKEKDLQERQHEVLVREMNIDWPIRCQRMDIDCPIRWRHCVV